MNKIKHPLFKDKSILCKSNVQIFSKIGQLFLRNRSYRIQKCSFEKNAIKVTRTNFRFISYKDPIFEHRKMYIDAQFSQSSIILKSRPAFADY